VAGFSGRAGFLACPGCSAFLPRALHNGFVQVVPILAIGDLRYALEEFLGPIGVIVTLVRLSIQIRQGSGLLPGSGSIAHCRNPKKIA
jgi:hypothetical protein